MTITKYEAYLGVHPILLKDGKDILHANDDTDEMWTLMVRIARLLMLDEVEEAAAQRVADHPELRPKGWNGPINRTLLDDLADVLAATVVGWEPIIGADLAEAPEVKRVLARYRAWSGR